jgi:hypothetical protein
MLGTKSGFLLLNQCGECFSLPAFLFIFFLVSILENIFVAVQVF